LGLQTSSWLALDKRGVWIGVFFAVSVILMAIGAMVPVDPIEAEKTYEELQIDLKYVATVPFIFGNNFMHCLIMFTPFFGPFYSAFIFFNTGTVIALIAVARNVNVTLLFVFLFSSPHTWLELFTYSLALSQSIFLASAIFKRRFKEETVRTCVIIAICALILLLAAIVEVILISAS